MSFSTRRAQPPRMSAYGMPSAQSPFKKRGFKIALAANVVIGAIVVGVIGVSTFLGGFWTTSTMENCVVKDKGSIAVEGGHEYRIYTENCDVLTVQDSLIDGKFSAASTYNEITVGKTHTFETRGKRVPVFSMMPNIISVQQTS